MRIRKLLIIIIMITLLSTTFYGINSVNSINNLAYVVSIGFDVTNSDKIEISFQIAIPAGDGGNSSKSSSSQSSSSIINSVECNSLESGINLVNSYLGKELNLSHCKAIIFSEEFASTGIKRDIYTLMNNIEIRPTCNIIISKCSAKYFLNNSKPMLEHLSSKYYEIVSTSEKSTGFTSDTTLQEFFNSLTDTFGECYAILGSVNNSSTNANTSSNVTSDSTHVASETPIDGQKNIETLGIAVFNGEKLVGELNGLESIAQLILTNSLSSAIISIPSPFESNHLIDLYIETSKSHNKVYLSNNTPYIKTNLDITTRVVSMSDDFKYLSREKIDLIEKKATEYVKSFVYDFLYKTSKEFKSDIVGFGRYAVSHFLTWEEWDKYNWLDNYQNAFFDVNVNVRVKSRYLIIDT